MKERINQILDLFLQENKGQVATQWNIGFLKMILDNALNEFIQENNNTISVLQNKIKELEKEK